MKYMRYMFFCILFFGLGFLMEKPFLSVYANGDIKINTKDESGSVSKLNTNNQVVQTSSAASDSTAQQLQSPSPQPLSSAPQAILPLSENEKNFPEGIISYSSDPRFSNYILLVDKSERKLEVFQVLQDKIKNIGSYPADIGKRNGEKTKANDYKTPVGIYFLQKKLRPPEITFDLYGSLAFTTDYPNIFDKRDYKTGNGIWLHAIPNKVALTRGSRGCVVVRDEVIKKLESLIKLVQTPILIFDKVNYLGNQEFLAQRKKYLDHFESWRKAWQDNDVETYIKFYDETFRNSQMNYTQWYNHKKKLKGLYKFIKVELSPPLILKNKNQVVIRTIQRYESDLHKDYGEKTIHAYWSNDVGFKIIREDWRPLIDEGSREMAGQGTKPLVENQN